MNLLNNFCRFASQNKNILMLLAVVIYILALYGVLSSSLIIISLLLSILFIFLLCKNYFPTKYIILWCLIFYLGVINTSIRLKDVDPLLNFAPKNAEIVATVKTIPQEKNPNQVKFFATVDKIITEDSQLNLNKEKVLITYNQLVDSVSNKNDLKIHDKYLFLGRLSTPFKAGNPSQFDYGNYLRNYDTYAVFYAKEFEKIITEKSFGAKVLQLINNYRDKIIKIHSKFIDSPNLEILGGIVFGDDAISPTKDIKDSFVNSGLLHILAASGMNVAFIYAFFFWFMSLFRINFKAKVVLGMLTVVVYSLMTGLGASIIRASTMLLFVLAGKLIDRDAHSISLLSFVALLMLIYNPMYINDVGFQLSFIVTFGILITSPILLKSQNKIISFVVSTISIPIIAQLWVIPIQIFYFNNISVYSVFANIMSVPILMALSTGGFISSLLSIITPISDFVCKCFDFILNPLITLLVNLSDFWGNLPNSTYQTTHPNVLQIFLYYLILLCITAFFYSDFADRYRKVLKTSLLILVSVLLLTFIPIKNTNLEITTFDVGNADCFLIKTPNNKYLMIDTGKSGYKGGKSQAEIVILKYLIDRGIKTIDKIIVTHFDNDHCGGVVDLIKNIKINEIYVNDLNHDSFSAKNIYKFAKDYGVKLIKSKNKDIVYEDERLVLTNYLAPSTDDDNENSIMTFLKYNNFEMLFTGDASAKGLESILTSLPQNIDILKVPHHGAVGGLNSKIVKHLNPTYSIVSVGENKFGHPSILTLELLRNSNILRTDINNAIFIIAKEKEFAIKTYDNIKRKFMPPLLENKSNM